MDPRLEKKPYEKYPSLFREVELPCSVTCMCWGCSHGDGWYSIIEEMCEGLKKYKVYFNQIKEKFGTLRVYYTCEEGEKGSQRVKDIINRAEARSAETCEECGAPGKTKGGGWISTLCDNCRDSRKNDKQRGNVSVYELMFGKDEEDNTGESDENQD